MTLKDILNRFHFENLSIKAGVVAAEISFSNADRAAAWEMYIELLTRVATQDLPPDHGDEKTALDSMYSIFGTTREVIKRHGPRCINFAKIAIVILNQVIRPFTSKWHNLSLEGTFESTSQRLLFRKELKGIQEQIRNYSRLLAELAEVEDLTDLEAQSL